VSVLRGLSSRVLPCGCLIGLYETYSGAVVGLVDAVDAACQDPGHRLDATVPAPDGAECAADQQADAGPPIGDRFAPEGATRSRLTGQ
jgi:hypothetical protein